MVTIPALGTFADVTAFLSEVTNYESEMPRLYSAKTFDLSRANELLDRCGRPERAFASVHVAGTKGKGSTCAMVDALARAAGWKTGLYTSPHLQDVRERIRVGGRVATDETWVAAARAVVPAALALRDAGRPPTFFEITTALGLEAFRLEGCRVAVLETGLGGRLDATTAVRPVVSVVTQIGLDHTALLGTTKEAIAFEKASIAKPGVPFVSGVLEPGPATQVERTVRALGGAPLERLGHEITVTPLAVSLEGTTFDLTTPRAARRGLTTALLGAHQAENAAVAVAAFEHLAAALAEPLPSDAVVRAGLAAVRWRGRLDLVRPADGLPPILVDCAHDPTSAARLVEAVRALQPHTRVVLLLAIAQDKEIELVLDALAPLPVEAVATRAKTKRAADPQRLAFGLATRGVRTLVADPSDQALRLARERARDLGAGLVLAAGSVYLAGEVLAALGQDAG